MTVFGNILVASQLEEAAINTLVKWIPTYLREIERQLGIEINQTPVPELYSNRNSFDVLPGEKFPKIVAISAGLADHPIARGTGQYSADWRLGVGVAIAAETEPLANQWVKAYGAAIRSIFLNYQSLGGLAQEITWEDEQYPDLDIPNQNMLYKAASVYFIVHCDDVATKWTGPQEPDEEPYAYGIVEHVIIDLEKLPIS